MTEERNLIHQAPPEKMVTLENSNPRQRAAAMRARVRKVAQSMIGNGIEWMRAKLHDDRTSDTLKLAIINDIEDRYGTPRSTRVASIDETAIATKMIEFKHFDPPPGWSDQPPTIDADGPSTNGANGDASHAEAEEGA